MKKKIFKLFASAFLASFLVVCNSTVTIADKNTLMEYPGQRNEGSWFTATKLDICMVNTVEDGWRGYISSQCYGWDIISCRFVGCIGTIH